jgi:hypothetical protein
MEPSTAILLNWCSNRDLTLMHYFYEGVSQVANMSFTCGSIIGFYAHIMQTQILCSNNSCKSSDNYFTLLYYVEHMFSPCNMMLQSERAMNHFICSSHKKIACKHLCNNIKQFSCSVQCVSFSCQQAVWVAFKSLTVPLVWLFSHSVPF